MFFKRDSNAWESNGEPNHPQTPHKELVAAIRPRVPRTELEITQSSAESYTRSSEEPIHHNYNTPNATKDIAPGLGG